MGIGLETDDVKVVSWIDRPDRMQLSSSGVLHKSQKESFAWVVTSVVPTIEPLMAKSNKDSAVIMARALILVCVENEWEYLLLGFDIVYI